MESAMPSAALVEGVLSVWSQQGNTTGAQQDGCATKRKEREGLSSFISPAERKMQHTCALPIPQNSREICPVAPNSTLSSGGQCFA